ncbi:hypothetical protein [Streptomyces sp. NPDC059092]|uniref:hypothetical protein n=1 Tax=Streptomyces sp. NPDC059092 TaxID=3346725 RepID=UPI0036864BBE
MSDQRKSDTKDDETRTKAAREQQTAVTPVRPLHAPDAPAGGTRPPEAPETPAAPAPPTEAPPTRVLPVQAPAQPRQAVSARAVPTAKAGQDAGAPDGRLFPQGESERLSERLQEALNSFVDGPRRSVEEAAGVLEDAARQLTTALAERPRSLRAGWDGERDAAAAEGSDTEELRLALQNYREMTQRLLRV